jgi:GNAT superfamily N-acetyltransferase
MLLTDIHVRSLIGPSLATYLHSIAKLRMDVFREYPFLEEPDLSLETSRLKCYMTSKEAIGVLIFDATILVGVSLGIPLSLERAEIQKPFLDRQIDLSTYYYFAESVLLKPYRNRGIGHHFFDVREVHVKSLKKYKHICFFDPIRPEIDLYKPADYLPLHDFWRKRGYTHCPDLKCQLVWKGRDDEKACPKTLTFWIKDLHGDDTQIR